MNFMGGRPGFYEEEDVAPSTRSDEDNGAGIQREHMFDKVVTPSDVGKLNRLVIPKQHAEKYFPLDSSSSSGEKGLLLNFEDRNGKSWRFRYSYWNSSQSYVMTKGWSRFVKDKKLDAGDIVSFHRGPGDRLFIDWRRRPDAPSDHHLLRPPHHHHHLSRPWAPFVLPQPPNYIHHHHNPYGGGIVTGSPCPTGSLMYLRPPQLALAGGRAQVLASGGWSRNHIVSNPQQMVFDSVPVVQGKAVAKRLRLFGVNMDCPVSADDSDDINNGDFNGNNNIGFGDCDMLLPSSAVQQQPLPFDFSSSSSSSTLARFRTDSSEDGKGKGSMSLDLDI